MLTEFSNVVLRLYRMGRDRRVEEFQDLAFDCVQSVLAFDSAVWLTNVFHADEDAATFHTRHFYRQPPQLLADWMKCQGATVFPRRLAESPGTSFACTPALHMEPEVAAHCRRYGIEQILTTSQIDPIAGLYELISLYRSDMTRPFSEDERLFQQCLAPHLSEAWRLNRWLHLSHAEESAGTSLSRSAAADVHGVLHLIDAGFTRLLGEEWPDWRGPRLPDELVAAIASGSRRFVGDKIVVAISGLHNQFLLQGREKSVADTLSQSKLAVATHFANGRSHKEIAQLLGLAPATVRNYLASVYLRLGVSSKTELANMLRNNT